MAKSARQKREEELKKKNLLRDEVVEFLKKHGGEYHYEGLYVHFDPRRTGNIGPVLQDLITYGTAQREGDLIKLRSYSPPQDSEDS